MVWFGEVSFDWFLWLVGECVARLQERVASLYGTRQRELARRIEALNAEKLERVKQFFAKSTGLFFIFLRRFFFLHDLCVRVGVESLGGDYQVDWHSFLLSETSLYIGRKTIHVRFGRSERKVCCFYSDIGLRLLRFFFVWIVSDGCQAKDGSHCRRTSSHALAVRKRSTACCIQTLSIAGFRSEQQMCLDLRFLQHVDSGRELEFVFDAGGSAYKRIAIDELQV